MGLKLDYKISLFFINKIFFLNWNLLNFLPVIIQEIFTRKVLMFAWINNYSLLKIFFLFYIFYFSRSRFNIWFKGFYSLNFQHLKYFYIDCDMDCILFKILQSNNKSCHTDNFLCFFNNFFI